MLEEDLGSDSEDEIDDEECEDETTDKVVTDTDIACFAERLAEAQLAAVKAERVAMAEKPNRKLYFDHDHPTMPGWFKGMEIIIRERGLWPEKGMNAQCDGFKCVAGKTDCCSDVRAWALSQARHRP